MFWLIFFLISYVGGFMLSVSFINGIRISALDILVACLNIWFWIFHLIRYPDQTFQDLKAYLRIFGAFILVAFVSLIVQIGRLTPAELLISSLYLWRFIGYSSVLIIMPRIKLFRRRVLIDLWFAGVGIAILGIIQYFLYPNLRNLYYLGWDPHQYRIFSTLLDPNFTGVILCLTIFLGLSLFNYHKNVLRNKIVIIALLLCFVSLLLTYSRGSYLAFLAGIIFWRLFDKGDRKLFRKIWEIGVIGVIFILVLFLLPRPGGEGVNLLRVMSVNSRMENMREAWSIFITRPVLGVGFNTLRYVRGMTDIVSGTNSTSHSGAGFHNSYLFLLSTTGILGLIAFFWIFWKIYMIGKIWEIEEFCKKRLVIASLAAVFIHSWFDNSLFYPFVMFWLFALAGSLKDFKRN